MQILLKLAPETRLVQFDSQEEAEPLLSLFEDIAREQGWKPGNQLRAYPMSSVLFGLEIDGNLVAGLQLVRNNETEGLPCLTVWPELNFVGRKDVADIALTAIDKRYRGRGQEIFWLLNIEMWRYCVQNGHTVLLAELPPRVLSIYRRLEWPFKTIGELRCHWGEDSYPGAMTTDEVLEVIKRKAVKSYRYHQFLTQALRP